ncbi:MerR family transcriptional regulator [Flavitalea antarctica]
MKNSTQITFAFQDPPEQGENPGVGVRIKSLKKSAGDPTKEGQQELTAPKDKSAGPGLFGEPGETVGTSEIGSNEAPQAQLPEPFSEPDAGSPASQAETFRAAAADIQPIAELPGDDDLPVFRGSSEFEGQMPPEDIQIEITAEDGNEIANPEAGGEVEASPIPEKTTKSTRGRKSLKNIDDGAELINVPPDEILFQKQYYAIGEVAEMFHVNQSLLRFWETEFDIIQPRKNRKGDRHFRPVDIKNLLLIHDLLRRRKLTIEGAKDFLKKNKRSPERFAMIQSLQKIKGFILEIKATL